jgi:phospholipid transport system substrate-binding protein
MVPSWKVVTGVFLAWLVLWTPAESSQPSQVVERLHISLLSVMKQGNQLDYKHRYQLLEPIVTKSHDLPFLAKLTVGKYWKTFDDEQQTLFVDTFSRLSIATYTDRFDGYGGERFSFVAQRELPRGKMLVETILTKSNGEKVQFNYLLRQDKNDWRIINIIVDGISDLAIRRAEYTSIFKSDGFFPLIAKMEDQIGRYSNSH